MKKIELLAPAGNIESLYAAVQAGANAVYLGGDRFSARAYAHNFDDDSMRGAVKYCHLYNVKIYVTMNTIMKEEELNKACEYAKFLYDIGVDALIIQDIGFFHILKENIPDFEIHASTQMTVHNGEAALFLSNMGFKRIVLSRELSLKEIRHISKELGIETEIFIHGALCVCYSGQCLMSSVIGGRSGNRGRCAQPCRLPYKIVNKKESTEKSGYLLSPKDMCTIEDMHEIIESGASSLKIEGRMKRPEYVAGVVTEYKNAIENFYDNFSSLRNDICINRDTQKKLLQLFNREGFSKAYLYGNTGKDMMAYSFPKNTGIKIGRAENDKTIFLCEDISLNDGVRAGNEGFTVSKIIKHEQEVNRAYKGERVKIIPAKYNSGSIIYKTSDFEQLTQLQNIYNNPYGKKFGLNLKVEFQKGKPIVLCTNFKGKDFKVEGEKVLEALKQPLSKDRICKSINKTGDNIFQFDNIEFESFEEGFLPISDINQIRRKLLNQIEKYILSIDRKNNGLNSIFLKRKFNEICLPEKMVVVNSSEQLEAALEMEFNHICINPFQRNEDINLGSIKVDKIYIKIPNIIRMEFDYIEEFINKNLSRIRGIVTGNLGIISKFSNKIQIFGDYKLNITNNYALEVYNTFTNGNCLSVELNRNEIKKIISNSNFRSQILVYGKIEAMVSEYCAIGSIFGGKSSCKNCNKVCEEGDFLLVDRKKKGFTVKTDKFCRSYIYNTVPVNLISNIKDLRNMGINSFRVDFIDENYKRTKEILKYFKEEQFKGDFSKFTRSHYRNGVE